MTMLQTNYDITIPQGISIIAGSFKVTLLTGLKDQKSVDSLGYPHFFVINYINLFWIASLTTRVVCYIVFSFRVKNPDKRIMILPFSLSPLQSFSVFQLTPGKHHP